MDHEMKRLVIYTDLWGDGGIETFLLNQLTQWDMSNMQCVILSAEKYSNVFDEKLQELEIHQEVLLKEKSASAIQRRLKVFAPLRQYFKEHPCDIAYFNLSNSVDMLCVKLAKEAGVCKRIVHSHNSGIEPSHSKCIKMLAHLICKQLYTKSATNWWACSDMAAKFLFSADVLEKVEYIPNGIEIDKFSFSKKTRKEFREKLGINSEEVKIIGTVGRCTPQKNQKFLLEVFAIVHHLHPDTKLLLAGDGPLRFELEERAKKLGIADSCIFLGFTNNIAPVYFAIDVFCLPSVCEGFVISALEAQAAGCTCLLSDTVTKQSLLLDNACALPLKIKIWAQRLASVLNENCDYAHRIAANTVVASKGYDKKTSAQKVQSLLF